MIENYVCPKCKVSQRKPVHLIEVEKLMDRTGSRYATVVGPDGSDETPCSACGHKVLNANITLGVYDDRSRS